MRVFIAVLVLIFSLQSLVRAEDISDFEIEGMSIGDSLLDYMSENKIKASAFYPYDSKKFYQTGMNQTSFRTYDYVQFNLREKDSKYILYGLSGKILFENDIKNCLKKKDTIFKEILNLFNKDKIKISSFDQPHSHDKSGESLIYVHDIKLLSGDKIRIYCTDWSDKFDYIDNLKVAIATQKLVDFFNNEAYD